MNIGFIGLGRMGRAMARRLAAAGYDVMGWDVDDAAITHVRDAGVRSADGIAAIAEFAEAVVLCLPGPTECEETIGDPGGLMSALPMGSLVVDTSTVGPDYAKNCAAAFAERSIDYVDAPTSGAEAGAIAGSLTIAAGGTEAAFARAVPILSHLGRRVEHVGPAGSGSAVKAINQQIYLTYCLALAEGVAVGRRMGLDPETLIDLLRASVAGAPLSTGWHERLLSGDRRPGFSVARATKDVALFDVMRDAAGQPAPIAEAVLKTLRAASDRGDLDIATLADRAAESSEGLT